MVRTRGASVKGGCDRLSLSLGPDMLTRTRFAALLLAASLVLSSAAPTSGAASKWLRLRTAHFELIGEVGQNDLARVGARFEQFRETFSRLFPNLRQPAAPVVIVVFRTKRTFEPFMPLFNGRRVEVAGYFLNRPGVNYIAMSLDSGDAAWRIVFHEYTHLLVSAALADVPVWFDEGVAEYNSTFQAESNGRKATLGRIVETHILLLREQFIPLRELMAVRHDSTLYNEGDRRSIFYAESWALMHYLMIGKPERLPQLGKYLALYAAGAPTDRAFRDAFGGDETVLEKELRQYVRREVFQSKVYELEDPVDVDRTAVSAPMSEAEGAAVLGDLLLQDLRLDEASVLLERARTLDPALGRALASLGRVRHLQSRDEDALKLLEEGTARAGDDYLPPYYLAATLLRPDKGPLAALAPDRAAAERAVGLIGKVVAKQPDLADAHALLGYGRLVLGDRDGSVAAYARAYAISPRQEYALMTAQAHVANRDATRARRILTALVEHGQSEAIRQEARNLLDRLSAIDHTLAGDALPAAAASAASSAGDEPRFVPVFRRVRDGETRESGVLQEIVCSRDAVVFVVDISGRELRVGAAQFAHVELISYRPDLEGGVSCGRRTTPEPVHVTWRPDGPPATAGRAIAIEFLPDGVKP